MIGIQSPVNGSLGKKIGAVEGAFVSFFVGTMVLAFLVLFLERATLPICFKFQNGICLGDF